MRTLRSSRNRKYGFTCLPLRWLVYSLAIFMLISLPGIQAAISETGAGFNSVLSSGHGYFGSNGLPGLSWLWRLFGASGNGTSPALVDRTAAVENIEYMSPSHAVAFQNQKVQLSALPTDSTGRVANGAKLTWDTSDHRLAKVDEAGTVTCLEPGLVWVNCTAGKGLGRAPLLIRPGVRPRQSFDEWQADQNSLKDDGTDGSIVGAAWVPSLLGKLVPTALAQGCGNGCAYGDFLWNDPRNLLGNPRDVALEPTHVGSVNPESKNFCLPMPILNLPGRELGLDLTAYYNSQNWFWNGSVIQSQVTGYPSTGFNLGFGYIATYPSSLPPFSTAYLFIDRDGTPRYLGQGSGPFTTTDGSHITFTGSAGNGGTLSYTDGTQVTMSVVNNYLLPTRVESRNGNYLTIAYKDATLGYNPFAIDFITDTLGRVITFNYDNNLNLASISAPGMNNTTQTLVQFGYQSGALQWIADPRTSTGYLFTYSTYGMIYNISKRRQYSGGSGGVESASANFNYPISGGTLTAPPAFTQRTESPNSGTYTYSSSTDSGAQTKTFTIQRPDQSTLKLTRSTNSSSVANGLMVQSEVKSSSGGSMAKSVFTYANDPGGSPQVQSAMTYDDTGTPTQVNFDYDSMGAIVNKREFGFQQSGSWVVRRRTHVNYTTAGGANFPTEVDLYDALLNTNDADDVLIAKTTYDVDVYTYGSPLTGLDDYGGTANPPGHDSNFNATYTNRGNLTGETQWTDLTANTTIVRQSRLNIFGVVTIAQLSCCNQKSFTYTSSDNFANASQITRGPSGGPQLTDTMTYDFGTSKTTGMTDPNGQQTGYQYDSELRPTVANLPSGAQETATYDDADQSGTYSTVYNDGGTIKTLTWVKQGDGWGHLTQTIDPAGNVVNYSYNNMGRLQSKTNPFPSGGTPGPSTSYQYDVLGRPTVVTLPDGNTMQTSYSGSTVTLTDEVGRKIQRQSDGLGRLITVTEQDPSSGSLSQATNYTYNYLDKLTQVNQGGQLRSWKYDALGRMTFENIPEQTATINDGTGTFWSLKTTYTDFSALATKTDARGVVITNGYDGLNRLTSVSYDTSHAAGVAATASVTSTFDTTTTSSTKGLLLSVTTSSGYKEVYSYDSFNRPTGVTYTIDGKTYTVSHQLNGANQNTQTTYPSGRVLPITHDTFGRLSSVGGTVGNAAGYVGAITRNAAELITGVTLGNGVQETRIYDANRLQLTGLQAVLGTNTLMNLTYSRSAQAGQSGSGTTAGNAGQLISVSGSINGQTESASFTYDDDRRLATSSQISNTATARESFALDRWGNRTQVANVGSGPEIQSITLQQSGGVPTNRIASVTTNAMTVNYSYDAVGNVTNDGVNTYTYDAESRLVSVNSGTTAQYAYGFSNHRVKSTTAAGTTHYVWHGNRLLAEHDGNTGNVVVDYILAGSSFVAKINAGVTYYFLRDRQSERLRLDGSGNVLGQMGTLPYGEDFAESGQQEKHHFTTYERDATGDDYGVNRFYSAPVGRFKSADPYRPSGNLVDPQSWNRYAYTRNDPVNRTDGYGLDDTEGDLAPLQDGAEEDSGGGGGGDVVLHSCPPGYHHEGDNFEDCVQDQGAEPPPDTSPGPGFTGGWWGGLGGGGGNQSTEPNIIFGKRSDLIQALLNALKDAINRLNEKKNCAKLFGGLDKAIAALNGATYRLFDQGVKQSLVNGRISYSLTGAMTDRSSQTVFLNTSGVFFRDPRIEVSKNNFMTFDFGTGLRGDDLGALLLLHELGHLVGKWGKDAGVGDTDLNLKHTMEVYQNCFQ